MLVPYPYTADSRHGRLMRLLLDELHALPVLPMHLPGPTRPDRRAHEAHLRPHRPPPGRRLDPRRLGATARREYQDTERLFTRDTGMSFGRWRQQARLLQALQQLAQGEKVIDVALALGYDSPGAFATMFKKAVRADAEWVF